jgi:hypothetical protein
MTSQDFDLDDVARFLAQMGELQQRVLHGRVNLPNARRGLQLLIEDQPVSNTQHGRFFVSCAQQLANLERWNEQYGWGFSEAHIARCYVQARTFDWPGDPLQAIVLVPSFSTPGDTLTALIEAASDNGLYVWMPGTANCIKEDPSRVRLVEGAYFLPNSLEWRLVDFGAHLTRRGTKVPNCSDLVTPAASAHAEVVAAAAHFPGWLRAIRKKSAPGIKVPGYRVVGADTQVGDVYLSVTCSGGDFGTTLHGYTSDVVWDGMAVATACPAPLGGNI